MQQLPFCLLATTFSLIRQSTSTSTSTWAGNWRYVLNDGGCINEIDYTKRQTQQVESVAKSQQSIIYEAWRYTHTTTLAIFCVEAAGIRRWEYCRYSCKPTISRQLHLRESMNGLRGNSFVWFDIQYFSRLFYQTFSSTSNFECIQLFHSSSTETVKVYTGVEPVDTVHSPADAIFTPALAAAHPFE